MKPKTSIAGISVLPSWDLLEAYLPLLSEGRVGCLEVTIDSGWRTGGPDPEWYLRLQEEFSAAGRLSAHALDFSPFASLKEDEQNLWLARLNRATKGGKFSQVSVHFGCQRGGLFTRTAPFPVPFCRSAVELGQAQMKRLQSCANAPVGLENLALAFSLDEVKRQGEFLDRLLEPVDGFLLLDIHNLYCQARNFGVEPGELLKLLPLNRVRELHLSGGSWSNHGLRTLRRDTHDGPVPASCFEILEQVLPEIPEGVMVILERLPGSAVLPGSQEELRRSFAAIERRIKGEVRGGLSAGGASRPGRNAAHAVLSESIKGDIERFQSELLAALAERSPEAVKRRLLDCRGLEEFQSYVQAMEPELVDIARELLVKWSEPRPAPSVRKRRRSEGISPRRQRD